MQADTNGDIGKGGRERGDSLRSKDGHSQPAGCKPPFPACMYLGRLGKVWAILGIEQERPTLVQWRSTGVALRCQGPGAGLQFDARRRSQNSREAMGPQPRNNYQNLCQLPQ